MKESIVLVNEWGSTRIIFVSGDERRGAEKVLDALHELGIRGFWREAE